MPDLSDPLAIMALFGVGLYIVASYLHWSHRAR